MFLRIYVAAPSLCWQQARDIQKFLRDIGHAVTHDWTCEAELATQGKEPSEKPGDIALCCQLGVEHSDGVVALLPPIVPTQGVWVELGMALALEKPCAVLIPSAPDELRIVEHWLDRAVFLRHPGVTLCGALEDVVSAVKRWKG
jgi:nucleoside 2-deoxyribosyltransferase